EAALSTGTNPESTAETTTGKITVGQGDGLQSLVIGGVDVTNGGTVEGKYGTLTVTLNDDGSYSWTYTLTGNTTDHHNTHSTGTTEGVQEDFPIVWTDSNGGRASAHLPIGVLDDGPVPIVGAAGIHAAVAEDALSTSSGDAGDKSEGNLDDGQTLTSDE